MERRFEIRLEELLEDAVLDRRIPEGMLDRLERFVKPFAAILESDAQRRHLREYVAGLFSDVKRKNAETIAYLHDQDRQAMQKFIGQSLWDDGLLIGSWRGRSVRSWASPMACWCSIPRRSESRARNRWASPGSGADAWGRSTTARWASIWVTFRARSTPWWTCGCISNKEWAKDKQRRKKCGVPGEIRFQTRHALALEMLAEHGTACLTAGSRATTKWGAAPHFAGICGLWKNAICWPCRRTRWSATWKRRRRSTVVAARRPKVPFVRVDRWREALPKDAWTTIDVRDGARGPLVVQAVKPRAGEDRSPPQRSRRDAGDSAGKAERRNDEARLLPLERRARNAAGGVCPRGQSRASDRGVPGAREERCGAGPVSGSQLDRLASPSNALAVGDVVSDARRPAGEKNTLRH